MKKDQVDGSLNVIGSSVAVHEIAKAIYSNLMEFLITAALKGGH